MKRANSFKRQSQDAFKFKNYLKLSVATYLNNNEHNLFLTLNDDDLFGPSAWRKNKS